GERLETLDPPAHEAVLTTAALARPTVALVEASLSSSDAAAALAGAVDAAVLEIEGERLRFTHPLIASVVYADASAAQRRAVHARIADVVEESEERARHLALGSDGPDADVALSLDQAARSVRARRCGGAVPGGLAPDAAVGDRRRGTAGSRCRGMPLRGRRLRSGPRAAGGGHGDAEQRAGAGARVPGLGARAPGRIRRRRRH